MTQELKRCGAPTQQQADEFASLHEERGKDVEPPRNHVGKREGDVHCPIEEGDLRQGPASQTLEPTKERPYSNELNDGRQKLSNRQEDKRRRILHLTLDRRRGVASIQ